MEQKDGGNVQLDKEMSLNGITDKAAEDKATAIIQEISTINEKPLALPQANRKGPSG